jgi:hypothetical protein
MSALARHRKPPKTSSDLLSRIGDAIPQDVFIAFSKLEVDDGLLDVERGIGFIPQIPCFFPC